jgi:Flp pilus assembly pilin Flp
MMLYALNEKGQGLVEYALLLALIALALVIAVMAFGDNLFEFYYNQIASKYISATTP